MEEEKKAVASSEKKEAEAPKKKSFFKGVKAEFKKVIWPSKASVARETGAVVFFGVVLGVLIAAIDAILKFGLDFIV